MLVLLLTIGFVFDTVLRWLVPSRMKESGRAGLDPFDGCRLPRRDLVFGPGFLFLEPKVHFDEI